MATSVNPATAEDRPTWVTIQMNTFTNWLNQQLMTGNVKINDLEFDLSDGVLLIQVVETLQKRICTGKVYRSNPNEIQKLMNVQMALDALREDRVKLVNIGAQDIVEGNLKLILGLIWCLIQRYQIASHTKIPPKKLIMAWLQSVLPEIKLTNFKTNWNDGIALAALLDYCQPGLFPDWRKLNPRNKASNCARALSLAEKHLRIPAIISAEHLSSTDLDELSTLTYLSYFIRKNGVGYNATLDNVQKLLPDVRITDFERSWNDGYLLCRLVEAVGGSVPGLDHMEFDQPAFWVQNVARGLDAALELGVASLVGADDIADIEVDHLGILALAAALSSLTQEKNITQPPKTTEKITSPSPMVPKRTFDYPGSEEGEEMEEEEAPLTTSCFQNQQLNLDLAFAENSSVVIDDISVCVVGPKNQILDNQSLELRKTQTEKGAVLSFIPKTVGKYQVHILCEQTELPSSPILLNVLPAAQRLEQSNSASTVSQQVLKSESSNSKLGNKIGQLVAVLDKEHLIQTPLTKSTSAAESLKKTEPKKMDYNADQASVVSFSGLNEPCSIGSIVEVVINAQGEQADTGDVIVYAESPTGRRQPCNILQRANSFTANFTPSEVGDWRIGILYKDKHIKGSPFICQVYDANLVQVYGLDVGLVGQELKFTVDASKAGSGELAVSILRHGKQIECHVDEDTVGPRQMPTGRFRVHFTPNGAGQYKIHIAFNNMEIKGSPFVLDIADANSVSIYGDNLRMASVDRLASFMIHAVGVESKDLSVVVTGPTNRKKQGRVIQIDEATFRIEWKPIESGEHLIDVRLYDQSIYESPFVCNVGDPELVSVKKIPKFIDTRDLNKDHTFEIDATAAGSGNLEIVINGGRVACRVRELSPREFVATFTPTQRVPHVIEMKFNGEHVRGSPWTVSTRESSSYADGSGVDTGYISELVGVGLHRAAVGELAVFEVSAINGSPGGPRPELLRPHNVVVKVTDPTGQPVPTRVKEQPTGVRCEYSVRTVGDHRLEVYINDRLIDSGPLYVAGYDPSRISIKPVSGSIVGQPVQFEVNAVEAGKGQLEISVNQGRVPNNVQMKGAGRCLVTFIPQHAGVYVIDVTFNGHQIHGCPIRVEVHAKQVGKPVSATASTTSAVSQSRAASLSQHGVAGTSPPPPPSHFTSSTPEKTTFTHSSRISSPTYVDTSYSYAVSRPGSRPVESPRSPPMVRQQSPVSPKPRLTDAESLRSPRLVRQGPIQQISPKIGHTVAQYDRPPSSTETSRRYYTEEEPTQDVGIFKTTYEQRSPQPRGDSGIETSAVFSPSSFSTPKPQKYFEKEDEPQRITQVETRYFRSPEGNYTKHVEELTTTRNEPHFGVDYRSESRSSEKPRFEPIDTRSPTFSSPIARRSPSPPIAYKRESPDFSKNYGTMGSHVYDEIPASTPPPPPPSAPVPLPRANELERVPLEETAQRTADFMRIKEEDERLLDKYGYNQPGEVPEAQGRQYSGSEQEQGIIEPYPSDLESLAQHSQHKIEGNLPREESRDDQSETAGSKPSSKPTTPKLSLRFGKSDKNKQEGPKVFDFGKSKISSKHEVVKKGKDVEVKVDNLKIGKEDVLKVIVTPPNKKQAPGDDTIPPEVPHKVKKSGKTYEISFKPTEVGTHKILVFVNDVAHPQAPFPIRVYDASQIVVGEIVRESVINDTVEFTVDAGRAGFGNLEMAIKDSDGVIIPSHVSQLETGSAKFLVTFNPTSLGMHTVNVTFNKEVIKGSPFEVKIVENLAAAVGPSDSSTLESKKKTGKKDKKEAKKDKKQKAPIVERIPSLSRVGKSAVLVLNAPGGAPIEAAVRDPTKTELAVKIAADEEGDEDVRQIQFTPEVVGDHEITIKVNNVEVTGSPYLCRVYDPAKIKVGQIPSGIVNKPVHFIVDAAEAGVGNLEVAVNEGTIASMARALGHHKYEISFVPLEAVEHKISIRFNNEPVPNSPFTCRITSQANFNVYGPGLERVPVGKSAEFVIQVIDDKAVMPEVQITDPRNDKLPVTVSKDNRKGEFTVEYTPKVVGNHVIEVRYNDQPIGPAFTSKAFDASQAKLSLEEEAQVGKPCTFLIDAGKAGAGNMEIVVAVDGQNLPNYVQAESQAKFKVSFTPQEPKEHVISVKFNGIHVPGSPMTCPVSGEVSRRTASPLAKSAPKQEEIRLVGDLAVAQVGVPKGFSIDSPKKNAECNVVVTGPNKKRLSVNIIRVEEGFDVEFLPTMPGNYEIDIQLDGRSLSICPIICQCIDDKYKVRDEEFVNIPEMINTNEKITFDVITGKLSKKDDFRVEICGEDGTVVPSTVKLDRSAGIAKVSCLVPHPGQYFVDVFRNNVRLGNRIHFSAVGTATTSKMDRGVVNILYFEKQALVERSTSFELEIPPGLEDQLHLEVVDEEGNALPVSLVRLQGDVYAAKWTPLSEGTHTVNIHSQGRPVPGTPLTVSVLDLSAVRVIGLKNDAVGVQQRFNIDWSNSGGSTVAVSIEHEDGEGAKCSLKKIKQGLHVCTFTPKKVGLYLLNISIDDVPLPECPYECLISASGAVRARGDALTRAQRGKTARFEVSLGNATRGELDVLVTDPLQGPLPVRCYKQQDDSYWVEFTPEQIGTHQIEVSFGDVPVIGSPFSSEVVDPRKVVIKGTEDPFILRHIAKIAINRRAAGNGALEVELADPQGVPLKIDQIRNSAGDDQITFLPSKLGPHRLSVKLAGFQVPGTPKQILVEEQGKPTVYGAALDYAVEKDSAASMIFDPKKMTGGIKVDVRSPDGEKVRHSTNKRPDGTSEISFRPSIVGFYKVSIDFNNRPVTGSPFQINVIDPNKVLINDENVREDGLLQLNVGKKNIIEVDTTAAGPGKLRAEVRDSEGELLTDIVTVENMGYGRQRIIVTPKSAENLKIYLYWAEQVVPTAFPLPAIAEDHEAGPAAVRIHTSRLQEAETSKAYEEGADKVQMKGDGLKKATIKQPAEFIIDGSDVPNGKITAQMIGDKADIPVRLQHLGNNVHKATYTPLQDGEYELHVLLDGKHVPGSPSTIEVRSHSSPAELVEVDSKSLKIGIIGEDVKTVIDTRKAGSGFLSAQCVGPSKLAYCELYDHRDGTYLLSLKPTELGKHTLVVKYSNEHVPGSPFVFNVSLPPDPSKVRVYGTGINHGILHSFKSDFIVETKGAGAGQLTVRVRGPKGAFNVEMQRDKTQDRTIHCKYEPREPGDYQVEVKWHGQHVPGSPFFVMIVDTEEELKRFLAGEPPSAIPSSPFIPPGYMGPPPMPGPGMMPPGPGYPGARRFYGPPPPGAFVPPPPPQLIQQQRRRH